MRTGVPSANKQPTMIIKGFKRAETCPLEKTRPSQRRKTTANSLPQLEAQVPFPCVVYTRKTAGAPYVFQHYCSANARKVLPQSLKVADLQAHDPGLNWSALQNECFLVLVAGDVAQCISVTSARDRWRTSFLFNGSRYSKSIEDPRLLTTEFHEAYIPLHLYGTLSVFCTNGQYHSTIPLESGICLFPRQISERDIPALAKWMESGLLKTLHSSIWVTEMGGSYNEHSLRPSLKHNRGGGGTSK
jgi:hypothetical protein